MFHKTRTYKGVWRYLIKDGHEHITSCLFLLLLLFSVGGSEGREKMNIVDLAIQQSKLNKEKYSEPHEKYVDTTYIAIKEDDYVMCSIYPSVLENAKQGILVHKRSKLADRNYYDWFDVEYIDENEEPFYNCLDKYFILWVWPDGPYRNQKLRLNSSDGIHYGWFPSWNNLASIKDCFQSMWNLYNELKNACTKERATIVRLYEQDEKILQQKKEIANFSYANALLEKERDMYKGLLDDIKKLLLNEK